MEKALSKLKMAEFLLVIGKRGKSKEKLRFSILVETYTMEILEI